MKVVVFGATGRTGRLLVEGALARGHDVTAFVRAPDKLGALRDRVRVVQGDVLDGGAVSDAVDGQEAALVALAGGRRQGRGREVNAQGTLNVIRSHAALRRAPPCRALGERHAAGPRPQPPVVLRARRQAALPARTRWPTCGAWRSACARASWTGPSCGRRSSSTDPLAARTARSPGYSLPGGTKIARADVAAFMLDELERRDNIAHALAIAY